MSLLRASGLQCHIRISQISQLVQRGCLASRAKRYYSDNADSSSRGLEKALCSPTIPLIHKGVHAFVVGKPGLFNISDEVLKAMKDRTPIVGLETAIYTHGFPKPNNYDLALEMEATVKDHGATPATIGILNGRIMIGMTPEQLRELAESAGSENTHKISRRDLAYHIAASGPLLNGGTTIAGTILLSKMAGIRVIATGGLGGVHKGGENSLDISADLTELSRNTIAVVTSGMKSFLDVPRTLEFLETQGVFVSTFGKKTERVDIPGFFSRESGYISPYTVESPEEAARILFANDRIGLHSGNLFFNPIPKEYEIPKSEMDPIIAAAVEDSSSITGKDNTPAVLAEIVKRTEGRSIEANRRLVLDNARIGAQMAVEFSRLLKEFKARQKESQSTHLKAKKNPNSETKNSSNQNPQSPARENAVPDSDSIIEETNGAFGRGAMEDTLPAEERNSSNTILVVGGVGIDVVGKSTAQEVQLRASNPGVVTYSVGGVAKNIAATLRQLDPPAPVRFLSAIGKDMNGISVLQELQRLGISTKDVTVKKGSRTACYAAINSDEVEGGLSAAIADMDVIKSIQGKDIAVAIEGYKPKIVCFDGNLDTATMKELCIAAKEQGALGTPSFLLVIIASMLADLGLELEHPIDIISPNLDELDGILEIVNSKLPTSKENSERTKLQVQEGFQRNQTILKSLQNIIPRANDLIQSARSKLAVDIDAQAGGSNSAQFNAPSESQLAKCITKSIELLHLTPTVITKLGGKGVVIVRTVQHPNPAEASTRPCYSLQQEIQEFTSFGHMPRTFWSLMQWLVPMEPAILS
ncbi:hypothetical protein TWF191_004923 [Orbilia oligospora]|uniref:Carbohydrate kinase PfkB domain-containing protein n=1 Tax=Orbilia oligospora TaxID=2813651 RepID=A0A7C8Q7F5_ORBOL|nr:hypothetical protein TWF191_004923 [Orbilia oligospora]